MATARDFKEAIIVALTDMEEAYGVSLGISIREAGLVAQSVVDELQRKGLIQVD